MTDIETIHPPTDRLAAYVHGRLDDPGMDEIEEHLSSCYLCCRLIRDQPGDSLVLKLRAGGAAAVATHAAEGGSAASAQEPRLPGPIVLRHRPGRPDPPRPIDHGGTA